MFTTDYKAVCVCVCVYVCVRACVDMCVFDECLSERVKPISEQHGAIYTL